MGIEQSIHWSLTPVGEGFKKYSVVRPVVLWLHTEHWVSPIQSTQLGIVQRIHWSATPVGEGFKKY